MTRPPRLPALLLRLFLTRAQYECIAGDLDEEFVRLTSASRSAAARWYWRQACRSIAACRFRGRDAGERAGTISLGLLRDVVRAQVEASLDER